MKIKKDKFRRARGGKSKILKICCSNCKNIVIDYQKDGDGSLIRCYLNRIIGPNDLTGLEKKYFSQKDIPNLLCKNCNTLIAIPMTYNDGRFAYRLIRGTFLKK